MKLHRLNRQENYPKRYFYPSLNMLDYVIDHANAIDLIFHKEKLNETYNIGGFNEWQKY